MEKKQFISEVSSKVKLVRTEYGYSQEKMALILGISKKTLVEIEKGRTRLTWPGAVTVCTLFGRSSILFSAFGGKPIELILTLAFEDDEPKYDKKRNSKLYWKTVSCGDGFRIQKNMISHLYRIMTENERRVFSSFDIEHIKEKLIQLQNKTGSDRQYLE